MSDFLRRLRENAWGYMRSYHKDLWDNPNKVEEKEGELVDTRTREKKRKKERGKSQSKKQEEWKIS